MVDLMDLLRDVLVCSLQVWMLNDFGKNMFPYRVGSLWKRIGVYFAAALCIFIANHMGTTLFNITIIPVSYTIAAIIIFQGSKWKKVIMACCYYMLAIIPEFLFAAITEAYGVTGTANEFQSELEKTLAISFLSHKFGKPYYKSISGKQDIEFNISHSGEMILVAFSRDAKIGVDIQEIIDCSEYLEIARSFFEPEEVKNIEESNSKELFFQYWSAKEAYLKAIGVGLLKGMSFFSVKDGVIKENGRKKDHWKLIPIKVQGYAAYIALKEKEKSGK